MALNGTMPFGSQPKIIALSKLAGVHSHTSVEMALNQITESIGILAMDVSSLSKRTFPPAQTTQTE